MTWYVQVNDTIGGWIVTTIDAPMSEHDYRADGDISRRGYVIAECMTEMDAATIASLLNQDEYTPQSMIDEPEKWA